MEELRYDKFSSRTHAGSLVAQQPSSCQFELTFGCGLRCRHCYSGCYNQERYLKKELDTRTVKRLLSKIRKQGVIWLCFTGGDPLARKDFREIYSYARKKGFLVSVFTGGYSLTSEIVELFKAQPPFVVEMTMNAVEKKLYERISGVKGSFAKAVQAIRPLKDAKIPLKIKTLVTKDNLSHVPRIKRFLALQGLEFIPDYQLFPRLNGDTSVLRLRIPVGKFMKLIGKQKNNGRVCNRVPGLKSKNNKLFWCALAAGQEFHIDPFGNLFLCPAIRNNLASVVERPLRPAFNDMLKEVREAAFSGRSKCSSCKIRAWCLYCPGKACLETGDQEAHSDYYCELTKEFLA